MGRKRGVQFHVRPSSPSASGYGVATHFEVLGARELARELAAQMLDADRRLGLECDAGPIVEQIHAAAAAWVGADPATNQILALLAIITSAAESTEPAENLVPAALFHAMKAGFTVEGVSVRHWIVAIDAWRAGPARGRPRAGAATPFGAVSNLLHELGVTGVSPEALEKIQKRHAKKPT